MELKEIFDKATSENKSLTYEEFEAIAKESKAKYVDLAEGKYVSKQKFDDDTAKLNTQITTLNDTIATRDADLTSLKEQLANAGTDASKLEEITANFTALQEKYTTETQALQSKLSEQAYEFAVRDFANSQKFSSAAAKRDFERSMLDKKLPMENGNIMGATDWMKEYAKANKDAFVVEQPKQNTQQPPQFATGTQPGNNGATGNKMSLSEMMKLANENPNAVISFD